jgi:hypothetical protein
MIIALIYAGNGRTKVVLAEGVKDLVINAAKGTWVYEGKKRKFAESRYCEWGCQYGVISVYDSDNLGHLDTMIYASEDATRDPNVFDDD